MTLLVRDEADIVDEQLRFHLDRGVDFVIATDHLSADGTSEILRRYEREGYAHVIREERKEHAQPIYVTRMARLAATEFGADWVINADADEFWWPREGSFQRDPRGRPAALRGRDRILAPLRSSPRLGGAVLRAHALAPAA